ncbi:DUF2809 domain-containing protein [Pantanalinema sp. GBBB05]|uniref:ribosomal maturation YjgA family protein n=1 Tax=Pantanalinema sp. GBBB05 TaxID=2604139 RepID=UPI001D99826C|nr:DUF2809 domain-containing protein [Pantanalinema sp. GBBB05]
MTSPLSPNHSDFRYRLILLISMIVIVPLGYIIRFSEVDQGGFGDFFGSVAYEIFWILLIVFYFPKFSVMKAAIAVCLATCAIEFLQLWTPPFLQAIRATLPGRLVLGNTFLWSDFPAYFVGSFLGWLGVRSLKNLAYARR